MFSAFDKIRFVKVEMSQNEIAEQDIYEYPTIRIYRPSMKSKPVQLSQRRTEESLIEFIKQNVEKVAFQDL